LRNMHIHLVALTIFSYLSIWAGLYL